MDRKIIAEQLARKNIGDDWYSYSAPEEYYFWSKQHQWKDMEEFGVNPMFVRIGDASPVIKPFKTSFTQKHPLIVKGGHKVMGYDTVRQIRSNGFQFFIDSTYEANEIMGDLCKRYDKSVWEIKELRVHNPKFSVILEFARFNPNGSGVGLYLSEVIKGTTKKYYPEMLVSTLQQYLGSFKGNVAQCTIEEQTQKVSGCVIKNKVTRSQIKTKKKK